MMKKRLTIKKKLKNKINYHIKRLNFDILPKIGSFFLLNIMTFFKKYAILKMDKL